MKRIRLLVAAVAALIGISSAAEAACPANFAQMKDNAAATFNMGLASDVNGNCQAFGSMSIPSGGVVSGAFASGSLASGAVVDLTNLSAPLAAGAATATKSMVIGGQFLSAQPTYTTTQQGSVLFTSRGELLVSPGVSGFSISNTTFAATQSGAWNVTNITGTVSLPTGASTSALQPTNAAIASTTSGQTGHVMMGAVTTAAPTYTTAQTDPLSLTTSGALRVDGSGVTQPVSLTSTTITGSVAVTNAGTFAVQNTAATPAGTNLMGKVGIDQTTPGTTNAVSLAQVNAATTLAGNGVTGTGSQRVTIASDNTAFAVNATLQASASTAIGKVDPNTIATWGLVVSTQNSATPTNMHLMAAQFNTTPTTITSGNVSALQLDNAGNLLVNIKAGASSGAVAQGSTTSGQSGGLTQAAVTTSAPSYTTAQTSPLSLTTAGNLRTIDAGLNTATGTTADAPCTLPATTTACSSIAIGKAIANTASSSVAAGTATIGNFGFDPSQGKGTPTQAFLALPATTTTQIIALSGTTVTYVTLAKVFAGGTVNVTFKYGTGTNCGTGTTTLEGPYPLTAQSGWVEGSGGAPAMIVPSGKALCVTTDASVGGGVKLIYQQI